MAGRGGFLSSWPLCWRCRSGDDPMASLEHKRKSEWASPGAGRQSGWSWGCGALMQGFPGDLCPHHCHIFKDVDTCPCKYHSISADIHLARACPCARVRADPQDLSCKNSKQALLKPTSKKQNAFLVSPGDTHWPTGSKRFTQREGMGGFRFIKRVSQLAQWQRICLPTQGTWVWSLVREDPTGSETTMCSRARGLQLLRPRWPVLLCPATRAITALRSPCTARREQPWFAATKTQHSQKYIHTIMKRFTKVLQEWEWWGTSMGPLVRTPSFQRKGVLVQSLVGN